MPQMILREGSLLLLCLLGSSLGALRQRPLGVPSLAAALITNVALKASAVKHPQKESKKEGTAEHANINVALKASAVKHPQKESKKEGTAKHINIDITAALKASAMKHPQKESKKEGTAKHIDITAALKASAVKHPQKESKKEGTAKHIDITAALKASAVKQLQKESKKEGTVEHADLNVGYCINGLARTFGSPLIYKSIVSNLVKPFGGQPHIFAALTLDEKHSEAKQAVANKSDVLGALDHLKAVVLGSQPPIQQYGSGFMLVNEEQQLRTAIDSLRANAKSVTVDLSMKDVSVDEIHSLGNATQCQVAANYVLYPVLVGQLVHLETCWTMITSHESTHDMKFDKLVYLRPDATWIKQAPWTAQTSWAPNAIMASQAGHDWAAFGSRQAMYHWFNRLNWHKNTCKEGLPFDVAVPVADGLPRYFSLVKVDFKFAEIPVVVVRDNKNMATAATACQMSGYAWKGTGWDCLESIYSPDGTPRKDEHGPWW